MIRLRIPHGMALGIPDVRGGWAAVSSTVAEHERWGMAGHVRWHGDEGRAMTLTTQTKERR
jgi:hypothetical protein